MPEPLYRYSQSEARRAGETDEWRSSYRANIECRNAIDRELSEHFDGMRIEGLSVPALCREYGIDRVGWVLAATILSADWDLRYRPANRNWAEEISFPSAELDNASSYCLRSHPEIVNGLADMYREYIRSLGLYGTEDCVRDSRSENYADRLLILKAEILKDEYRSGDYQLFFARSGFGCDSLKIGKKVFGEFLIDGEKASFSRQDFCGIADEARLPQWAKERLTVLRSGEQEDETTETTEENGMEEIT